MNIKRYIEILNPYVCFLTFLLTSQNETNFETEKIIDKEENIQTEISVLLDQQNKINTESTLIIDKQEKKQVSFFFVIISFIFFVIIASLFSHLYNKKSEKKPENQKSQETHPEKQAQSEKIKIELIKPKNQKPQESHSEKQAESKEIKVELTEEEKKKTQLTDTEKQAESEKIKVELIKPEKKKTSGIYAKKEDQSGIIKLELFLGEDCKENKEFYDKFTLFFKKVFKALTKDVLIDFGPLKYAQVIEFRNLDFFRFNFEYLDFFHEDKFYQMNGNEVNLHEAKNIKDFLTIVQKLRIEQQKEKFIFKNKKRNTILFKDSKPLFEIETFFHLLLSENDFYASCETLPKEDGSYFINGFNIGSKNSQQDYILNAKHPKLYNHPLLLTIANGKPTYSSNSFLLFIFIIYYDKGYLDSVSGTNYFFKFNDPERKTISYQEIQKKCYYFGREFFAIFDEHSKKTQIFDLRIAGQDPSFDFVYGDHSDTVLISLKKIQKEKLKPLTDALRDEKDINQDFSKLDDICFFPEELSEKILISRLSLLQNRN